MIALGDADRIAIDAAVDAAFDRLRDRAAPLGSGAAALADAAASAGADGKRLRPRLVVAAFRALADRHAAPSTDDTALWQVAAAFEVLHTAFVVHDDLIDRDVERRGIPNVGGRFRTRARRFGVAPADADLVGDAAAVLAGDLLLAEAGRLIAAIEAPADVRAALLAIMDDAILVSVAGELADVENAVRSDVPDTDDLLEVARAKTAAYTFEAPLLAGAVLAGASGAARAELAPAAADLGLAFQLVDDLIGTFGTRRQAGREPGADLREAKRTPLIGLARRRDAWPQVRSALALAHTGPIAVRRAQRELEASGARDDVEALVHAALRRARARASSPDLPVPAAALLSRIATVIEERIP